MNNLFLTVFFTWPLHLDIYLEVNAINVDVAFVQQHHDRTFFQIPDFGYYFLAKDNYADHFFNIDLTSLPPMRNGYSDRHFWHQSALMSLSILMSTPDPSADEDMFSLLNDINCHFPSPCIDHMFVSTAGTGSDDRIDIDMIDLFDVLLDQMVEKPTMLMLSRHLIDTNRGNTIEELYRQRITQWGVKICVIDLINRNYLVMMHRFFIANTLRSELFPSEHNFEELYFWLTDYNRFSDCGDLNMYSNVLARMDAMFNLDFLREGVPMVY
jgi:hypothetical protein